MVTSPKDTQIFLGLVGAFGICATLRQIYLVLNSTNDPLQPPEAEEQIFAYVSRKLNGAETRYSTYSKKLAINDALKHWRYHLLGRKTKITTDRIFIKHMLTQPRITQRQMRTLAEILEYDFEINYLPSARNYIQDALSRRPDYKEPPILSYQILIAVNQVESIMSLELDKNNE
jgi:hypothetical protein